MIEMIKAQWGDYELIDCGDFLKLERFGEYTLIRPEPQAIWSASLEYHQWEAMADAVFRKSQESATQKGNRESNARNFGEERGEWYFKSSTKGQWTVDYKQGELNFLMRLGFTAFKHIGIFPEQAPNWQFIAQRIHQIKGTKPNVEVLNMFAYTGGATLAALSQGAEVTHVDSVKQTVSWSKENVEINGWQSPRWIVEDALKFAKRQVRRGAKYDGIILDPPAYGRGADGEKWILQDNIREMLECCRQMLAPGGFLVLNLYSMGFSSILARTLVESVFASDKLLSIESGELYVEDRFNKKLPLGIFVRCELDSADTI